MITTQKKSNAFGIIEVLIASTIIVIAISALTFVAQTTLTATSRTADRIQAANLAAEGIEIVRQIRDTAWIAGDSSSNTFGNWSMPVTSYVGGWSPISPGSSYRIGHNYNPSTPDWNYVKGFFLYPPTAPWAGGNNVDTINLNGSIFTRVIKIDSVGNLLPDPNHSALATQAYKVTAIVTTPSNAQIQTSEILTNWRPNY